MAQWTATVVRATAATHMTRRFAFGRCDFRGLRRHCLCTLRAHARHGCFGSYLCRLVCICSHGQGMQGRGDRHEDEHQSHQQSCPNLDHEAPDNAIFVKMKCRWPLYPYGVCIASPRACVFDIVSPIAFLLENEVRRRGDCCEDKHQHRTNRRPALQRLGIMSSSARMESEPRTTFGICPPNRKRTRTFAFAPCRASSLPFPWRRLMRRQQRLPPDRGLAPQPVFDDCAPMRP